MVRITRSRFMAMVVLLVMATGAARLHADGLVQFGLDWRTASRESAKIAPKPDQHPAALVQIYQARAFSWRGLFGVHTWVALKPELANHYTVLEVLGWNQRRGLPIVSMVDAAPDRLWFNARPEPIFQLSGAEAATAIPKIFAAAQDYPFADTYRVWPGPNSNTFTAHIIRQVPELHGAELGPTAIGKDYLSYGIGLTPSQTGVQLSLFGAAGVALGVEEGLEINLLGLTFGLDLNPPALKLPIWGRLGLANQSLVLSGYRPQ